jgi:hypothetical protein
LAGWDGATYGPPLGARFLTRDPLEAVTRDPYGYAGSNPANNVDPLGLFCVGDFCTPSAEDVVETLRETAEAVEGAVEGVGSAARDAVDSVAAIDLGGVDWGTLAAGTVNVVYGGIKIGTGVPVFAAGGAATVSVPVLGQLTGIPAMAYGAYQFTTGASRLGRGLGQLADACTGGSTPDPEGQSLGANFSRFLRGIGPVQGGSWWDRLGGLP